ncbi:hypothetical protein EV426DRAFT_720178 [Tirmania nivea]|nr:hypothetical protein EV426DRAFT_720178 [Tirmania nivea]
MGASMGGYGVVWWTLLNVYIDPHEGVARGCVTTSAPPTPTQPRDDRAPTTNHAEDNALTQQQEREEREGGNDGSRKPVPSRKSDSEGASEIGQMENIETDSEGIYDILRRGVPGTDQHIHENISSAKTKSNNTKTTDEKAASTTEDYSRVPSPRGIEEPLKSNNQRWLQIMGSIIQKVHRQQRDNRYKRILAGLKGSNVYHTALVAADLEEEKSNGRSRTSHTSPATGDGTTTGIDTRAKTDSDTVHGHSHNHQRRAAFEDIIEYREEPELDSGSEDISGFESGAPLGSPRMRYTDWSLGYTRTQNDAGLWWRPSPGRGGGVEGFEGEVCWNAHPARPELP